MSRKALINLQMFPEAPADHLQVYNPQTIWAALQKPFFHEG